LAVLTVTMLYDNIYIIYKRSKVLEKFIKCREYFSSSNRKCGIEQESAENFFKFLKPLFRKVMWPLYATVISLIFFFNLDHVMLVIWARVSCVSYVSCDFSSRDISIYVICVIKYQSKSNQSANNVQSKKFAAQTNHQFWRRFEHF
jgi:hypothetical protein